MKYILTGIAGLAIVFISLGFLLPDEFEVKHSAHVNAPADDLYGYFSNLSKWESWAPWKKRDTTMQIKVSAVPSGKGAWLKWSSLSEGSGSLEITEVKQPGLIKYNLTMEERDMEIAGTVRLNSEPDGGTRIIWENKGTVGWEPWDKIVAIFMSDFLKEDMQESVNNLNEIVDKE